MGSVLAYTGDAGFENYCVVRKQTLNYTDAVGNSNKYYSLELHESNGRYRVFTQYGRVGAKGRQEVRLALSRYEADCIFDDLVHQKEHKGYRPVDLVQSTIGSEKGKQLLDASHVQKVTRKAAPSKDSNLHPTIQGFILQIFDEAEQKISHLVRGSVDSKGASPLGTLSTAQIDKGRRILRHIASIIDNQQVVSIDDVLPLSNEYFANIPRAFGSRITPRDIAIISKEKIQDELDILKLYEDALRMAVLYEDIDIDEKYASLNSDLGLLDPKSSEFKDIVHYVKVSESPHHSVSLSVKNIFTVKQKKAPQLTDKIGNVKQLFHGTRSANMPGILSSHLTLPTKLLGISTNGAMYGTGIYFSDQSTKSSQYSMSRFGGTTNKYKTAFMFLCDVALGRIKKETAAHYYTQPPRGYDSVMGVKGPSLLHNEYIIYAENQQRITHIIEFTPHNR